MIKLTYFSHKNDAKITSLWSICDALDIPYEELLHTYDKTLTLEQKKYDYLKYISYNKVPLFSNIENYIDCPPNFKKATFAYKVPDDAMAPMFNEGTYAYIEINGVIDNKAIGLFKLNDDYLIRRLMYKKDKFVLKARNKEIKDITVSRNDNLYFIGRIYL